MKKLVQFLIITVFLFVPGLIQAQSLSQYGFETGIDSSKWVDMTTSTQILTPSNADGAVSQLEDIGFAFPFGSQTYTQFSVNTDGNLRLGSEVTGASVYSQPFDANNANIDNPKITGFGCDGFGVSGIHYVKKLLVETNGDTMLVVEFCMGTYNTTTRNQLYKWQIHLNANGNVDIVYPGASGIPATAPAPSRQCGLCINSSDGWTVSANHIATHFTDGEEEEIPYGTWPDAGRYYTFLHPSNVSCPAPLILALDVEPTSATLTWTPGGTESLWALSINGNTVIVSDTTYTFTGLTANTNYSVSLRAICGAGDTSYMMVQSFRTACAYISIPYSYGFEDVDMDGKSYEDFGVDCWVRHTGAMYGSGYPNVIEDSMSCHSGGKGLVWYMRIFGKTPEVYPIEDPENPVPSVVASGNYQFVVLPGVDTSQYPVNGLSLEFWAQRGDPTHHPKFMVGVMTDPNDLSTLTLVDSVEVDGSDWGKYVAYLAGYQGTGRYVALGAINPESEWGAFVDDITLDVMPSCPFKSELSVDSVGTDFVSVSWHQYGNESGWLVYMNGQIVGSTTGTAYRVMNLTENTPYTFEVAALCGSGDTSIVGAKVNAVTSCASSCSYQMTFVNPNGYAWNNGGITMVMGSNSIDYTMDGDTLKTVQVEVCKGYPLDLIYSSYYSYWNSFYFINGTTGDTVASFVDGSQMEPGVSFYHNDNPCPTCGYVVGLTCVDSSATQATLEWSQVGGEADGWQVRYVNEHTNIVLDTIVYDTVVTLTGLNPSSPYSVIVVAGCNDTLPSPADTVRFSTPTLCAPVSGLALDTNTVPITTADIVWTPGGSENSWNVKYVADGETDTVVYQNITTPGYTLTGLTPLKTYNVYVQSDCGIEMGVGSWRLLTFNTQRCAEYCEYEMHLADSYGDGWNGASIAITQGQWSQTVTMSTGRTYDTTISVCYGEPISFKFNSGRYNGECSFQIIDQNGDTVFASYNASTLSTTQPFFTHPNPCSPCGFTSNLAYVDSSSTWAAFAWNYFGSSSSWMVRYVADGSTDTLTLTTDTLAVTLNNLVPSTQYKLYVHPLCADGAHYLVDSLSFVTMGGCVAPSHLILSDTTETGVTLSWRADMQQWNLKYVPAGTTDTLLAANLTTPSYTFSGLGYNTLYHIYVQSACGNDGNSSWTNIDYTTSPRPITLPYNETFDNVPINEYLILLNAAQPNYWTVGTSSNGTRSLFITNDGSSNGYNKSSQSTVFAYAPIQFTEQGLCQYSYDWQCYGESTYDYLRVALVPASVALTPGNTTGWSTAALPSGSIALDNGNKLNLSNSWTTVTGSFAVDSSIYANTWNLVFYWRNDGSQGSNPAGSIDNISLNIPSCQTPADLAVLDSSITSATLTWSQYGTPRGWTVSYLADGSTDTLSVTTDTALVTLANLAPATSYTVRVQTQCDSGDVSNAAAISLKTLCDYADVPYYTGFESSSRFPDCWWRHTTYNSNYYPTISSSSSYAHSGNRYIYVYQYYNTQSCLALPPFQNPANLQLSFYAKYENYPVTVEAGVLEGHSFIPVDSVALGTDYPLNPYIIPLSGYTGNGHRIALRFKNNNGYGYCYLDDITVETIPPCPLVDSLVANVLSDSSAHISWFDTVANAWNVKYVRIGSTDTQFVYNATTNATLLNSLADNSNYYVYVQAVCGNDGVGNWLKTTFSTPCALRTVPFFQDFENAGNTLPSCWTTSNAGFTSIYTYSSYSHSGTRTLYIRPYNGESDVVLPEFANLNTLMLTFFAKVTSLNYMPDTVEVGVMENGVRVPVSYIGISDVFPNDPYLVSFAGYTGSGSHPYIRVKSRNSTSAQVHFDDIALNTIPECMPVRGINVASLNADSATLQWLSTGSEAAWNVKYIANGTYDTATLQVMQPEVHLQQLQASNVYTVWVQAACGNLSTQWNSYSFSTPCNYSDVPYSMDFESEGYNSMPSCWNSLRTTSAFATSGSGYANSGQHYLYLVPNNGNLDTATILLPPFQNPSQLQVRFYIRTGSGTGAACEVGVVEGENRFVAVDTVDVSADYPADPFVVPLDAYRGSGVRPAFRLYGGGIYYVDDVAVEPINSCPFVTAISDSGNFDRETTVSWTPGANESAWNVKYVPDGSTDTLHTSTSLPSVVLTDLIGNSNYYVYVQAVCDSNHSSIWNFRQLSVPCEFVELPYQQNFNDYELPSCWATLPASSGNVFVSSSYAHEGNYSLYFYYAHSAILPPMRNISSLQLSFFARTVSSTPSMMAVGVMENDSFVPVDTLSISNSYPTDPYKVNFGNYSGNGSRIALQPLSTYETYYVDELLVDDTSACQLPPNLSLTAITAHSASLHWNAGSSASQWNVKYVANRGSQNDTVRLDPTGNNTITLSPLSPNTIYHVYLQSVCDAGGNSIWRKLTFTTDTCQGALTQLDTTICNDSYLLFDGRYHYSTGVYNYNHISQVDGCDSIVRLNLTVNPAHRITLYDTVCRGTHYIDRGFDIVTDSIEVTTVYDTLFYQTAVGCDSNTILRLRVVPVELGDFTYITPLFNHLQTSYPVNFSWTAVPGATHYDLYLWDTASSQPASPLLSGISSTSVSMPTLGNNSGYFWRLRAYNECAEKWSAVRNLNVTVQPALITRYPSLDFGEVAINDAVRRPISVYGTALTESINIQIIGTDADVFAVEPYANFDSLTGGSINVTFHPDRLQENFSAAIVYSSASLTDTTVLSGSLANFLNFTARADANVYSATDTVVISGHVTNALNQAVANHPVEVFVNTMGYRRTLPATTDASGNYTALFIPKPSEAGYYTLGAGKPGVYNNTATDDFNIPGLSLASSTPPTWLIEVGDTIEGDIVIKNRSSIPVSNILVEYDSLPDGAQISFAPLSLGALEQGSLHYTLTGSSVSDGNFYLPINLRATANDGTRLNIAAWYYCQPSTSQLIVQPQQLVASVARGTAKAVTLMLVNNGNNETGNISFTMPEVDWMYPLVDTNQVINIAPGDTGSVSMYIRFDRNASLSRYTGSFTINCPNGENVSVPYTVSTVSDTVGDLLVRVADDYTYNTAEGRYLEGASVVLRDYYSLDTVFAATTNADGEVAWSNIPEGFYRLYVYAQRHSQETRIIEISATEQNVQNVFLSYQAVSYEWVVQRTEIDDSYDLSLEAVFETSVPAPTLIIEAPSQIEPPAYGDSTVFNIIVTNYGLINAYNYSLSMPSSEEFTFRPLYDHIDTVEASHAYIIPCVVRATADHTGQDGYTTCRFYLSGIGFYYCNKGPNGYEWKQLYSSKSFTMRGVECPRTTTVPTTVYHTEVAGGGYVPCAFWCGGGSGGGGAYGYSSQPSVTQSVECQNTCVSSYQEAAAGSIALYGECGASLATAAAAGQTIAQGSLMNCVAPIVERVSTTVRTHGWIDDAVADLQLDDETRDAFTLAANMSETSVSLASNFDMVDTVAASCEVAYTMADQLRALLPAIMMRNRLSYGMLFGQATVGCVGFNLSSRGVAQMSGNADMLSVSPLANEMMFKYYTYAQNMVEIIDQLYAEDVWSNLDRNSLNNFVRTMDSVTGNSQMLITTAGRDYLVANNPNIAVAAVDGFVARWNRTVNYWCQGWYGRHQVSADMDTHFVELNATKLHEIRTSVDYMFNHGFVSPYQMYIYPIYQIDSLLLAAPHSSVCAKVTVKFSQRVAMTREAFDGTLSIFNGTDTSMTNIEVLFVVKDAQGVDKSDLFQINSLSLDRIDNITNGTIISDNEATIKMRFIPERGAAPTEPVVYYFGGSFSYLDLTTGERVTYDFVPVDITVNPSPNLEVDYFLQRYILGDDALTLDKVEPSEPATLAMRFANVGYGAATNVIVESMQPEITENGNGLAIDFNMIGSLQNGNEVALGLTDVHLGDISAHSATTAEWLFTSTLLGKFTPLSTSIIHNDSYGNPELSLITSLHTHQLLHLVTAYGSQDDGRNDFLVNDIADPDDYPDSLYFSNGGRTGVVLANNDTIDVPLSEQDSVVHLIMTPENIGWNYVRTADPGNGQYEIVRCVRDDGQEIPLKNVWLSFVDLPQQSDPVYVNRLHLVDTIGIIGPTGYNITFRLKPELLKVVCIEGLPSEAIDSMLTSFDVVFNKAFRDSTFSYEDMSLKCNNGNELMDQHVSVAKVNDTRYTVTLNDVNHFAGLYVLKVHTNNIVDLNGYNGHDGLQGNWIQTQASVPVFSTNFYDTICQYQSYSDNGFNADTTGIYTQTFSLPNGYDSVVNLYLTVLPISQTTDTQVACQSFTWINGETYTASNYSDTVLQTGVNGCDSIITLNLTVNHITTSVDVQTACDSYTWIDGNTYTASTSTPTYTTTNAAGCDSTVTLNLTINNSTTGIDVQTACDEFTWINNVTYTASNDTATYVLANAAGCDSTVTLNLTINNSTTGVDIQTACDEFTWINNVTYTASNDTATYVLANAAGCDSTVTLNLTVNSSSRSIDNQTACNAFTWIDGNTYTNSLSPNDNVTFTTTNAAGCDSTIALILTVNYTNRGIDDQSACDTYTWIDGNTYTNSVSPNDNVTFTTTNAAGCDSVVILNLTINNSTSTVDVQTACDSYTWHGTTYTASTSTPTYTTTNAAGCDSTVTLNLTINTSTTGVDVQTACDSYTWHGTTYTASTSTPTYTTTNAAGCDSTVTLNLTINNSTTGVDVQTACDSYTWHGTTYTASTSTPTYTTTNAAGCDSTVTLNLTILPYYTVTFNVNGGNGTMNSMQVCSGQSVQLPANSYTNEGYYFQGWSTEANGDVVYSDGATVTLDGDITLYAVWSSSCSDVVISTAATACDTYSWRNNTYRATGVYNDTVINAIPGGCDSTVTLNLTINNSTTGVDVQTACDSYTWIDGTTYTASTSTPTYTTTNAAGCDSTVTLNLTINTSTTGVDIQTACDSYTWHGTTYTASTSTQTYTTTNSAGCDSTVTLNLTINNSTTGVDVQTACDSYTWHGTTYTASTSTPTYTTTNAAGCDSTVTLNLTINNSTTGVDIQTACDSYTWHGTTYTASTSTPTYTTANAAGCDSTVTLNLTINNSTTGIDIQTACDSYTWIDGNSYTASTSTQTFTTTNVAGCDSTVTLNLTINTSTTGVDVQTACDSYTWIDGNTYTASTSTQTFTTTNAAGCDSTVTLNLTINNSTTGVDVQTACDSYTWIDGNTYTASTSTPPHTTTNAAGCDSTVTLNLTINTSTTGVDVQTACDSYTWHGTTYTASTSTPTYTTTNAAGCDSTVTLNLTINNSTTGVDVQTACDSYTWHGTTYTASTSTPTYTTTNAAGCDSTVTLNLTINNSTTGVDVQTACDSYTWIDGNSYTASTSTPTYTTTNAAGCDSTVTLNLTILPYYTVTFNVNGGNGTMNSMQVCSGQSVQLPANSYTNEGYYFQGWSTEANGDVVYSDGSTVTLDGDITLYAVWSSSCSDVVASTSVTACNSYSWRNNTYRATGVYKNRVTNAIPGGCDSVYQLVLTINNSTTGVDIQTACDSYTWHGTTYTASTSTPTYTTTNAAGCDSTVTLNLTINASTTGVDVQTACDSYTWHGTTYTASTSTPTYTTTNAAGCDSTVTLNLTINNSTTGVDIQTACDSYTWHGTTYTASTSTPTYTTTNTAGCDSTVTLNLTINNSTTGVDVQIACDSYTWHGTTYTASTSTPTYTTTNAAGCDSTVTLNLTINNSTTGVDVQTACDSYTWIDGTTYTASTSTPTYTTTNAAGCDSTVTLNLTINNSTTGVDVQTACDSYTWHGTTYTVSTSTPTYTTINTAGCDSSVTLNLTINNSTTGVDIQTACDSYTWHGTTYTASTSTPTYSTTNSAGCDSTVTLNLTINTSTTGVDIQTACDSYTWHGTTYTASTSTPTYTTTNAADCDSTVTLNLTINNSTTGVDVQTACDSYTWHGTTYTASTSTPTYTTTNAAGCDSTVTLNLTINNSTTGVDIQTACDSYTWHGTTYTASTSTPTYTTTNAAGCDSTVTLNLTINNSTTGIDVQTACDSYTWIDGNTYTVSTSTQTYTTTNAAGCDSTVTLNLTINNSTTGVDVQTACDSYTWHGTTYTASTSTPTYTTTNAAGCDSTVTLNLTINTSTTGVDVQTACDSYTWHGTTYTASTSTPTYTTTNAAGCDSTVTLNLTINNSTTGVDVQTACDSYTWHGTTYTATTSTPTYTTTNAAGCDSTVTLNLTINNSTTGVDIQTACDSYIWHGTTYTASTSTPTYTTTNAAGCDSTVTLNLTINNSTTGFDVQTACDSYTWHGTTYTASTSTPTYTTTNAAGCDSTVTLNLTINNSTTGVDVQTACDSYTWHGTTYTASTSTPTYTTTNATGCDSTVTLNLTINNSTTGVDVQTACDSYTWHGTIYTASTSTPTYTTTNAAGCDSTVTLNLTINNSTTGVDVQTACDSYTWHGTTYTASTSTPTYTTTNAVGCDSTVTLNLTINNSTTGVDVQTACDSYTWHGTTYTASTSTPIYTTTNAAGCDSTVTLNLTINNSTTGVDIQTACDEFTWINDVTYTASNDTATYVLTNAAGCDSTVTLNLTVNYSSYSYDTVLTSGSFTWIDGNTYTVGDTTVTFVTTNVAGCDSIMSIHIVIVDDKPVPQIVSYDNLEMRVIHNYDTIYVDYDAYQWYRNGEPIEGATEDYFKNEDESPLDGCYYVMVPIDAEGTNWVMSNVLCFNNEGIDEVEQNEVSLTVSPNPVRRGHTLRIETSLKEEQLYGAKLEVYDILGVKMYEQTMAQPVHLLNADFPSGSYVVRIRTEKGIVSVKRFVVK